MSGLNHNELHELLLDDPSTVFRRVFDSGHVALEIGDPEGRVVMVNPAWERMTGYAAAEVVGRPLKTLVRSELTDPSVYDEMDQAVTSGLIWSGTYVAQRKDGSSFPQRATLIPIMRDGQLQWVVSFKNDLSESGLVTAAQALAATRAGMARDRFISLMNAATDAIFIAEWESARFIEVNDAACQMFRTSREELLTLTGRMLASPESGPLVTEASRALHETGSAHQPCLQHQRRDGSLFWAELKVDAWESLGERFTVAIIRDITERVEREEALEKSQALFRAAFEHAPIGFVICRPDGTLASVNPALCQMLGHEESALLGRKAWDFTHRDDWAEEAVLAQRLLEGRSESYALRKRFLHRDGHVVHAMLHVARAQVGESALYIGQVLDVSEAHRTQRELERSSHLAALGRMAAAVAHDVNNPSAYLRLNLAELQRQLVEGGLGEARGELHELLHDCISGVDRIGDIVRELQNFERGSRAGTQKFDLAEVVRLSCRLASHEVRHRATLAVNTPGDAIWVDGSASKLGQVITNLVINAGKAIGEGDSEEEQICVSCDAQGGWVTLTVTDTGPGLPADPSELFEPFVSGSNSAGQGLGLWICSEIVRQHDGTITAENLEQSGARFTVRLPIVEPPAPKAEPPTARAQRGRVLVIDDEPAMLRAYQRALGREHDVELFDNATDALERVIAGGRFGAIVCDMMMPGMDGAQFYERLEALAPGQARRVMFVTGGAITGDGVGFLERLGDRVLRKPVHPRALLAAVQALVEMEDEVAKIDAVAGGVETGGARKR